MTPRSFISDLLRQPRSRLMLVAALVLGLSGCASSGGLEVVSRAPGFSATPGRGLMIVNIDTDIPLDRVSLNRYEISGAIPKGEHFWVVELPAGRYSWDSLKTSSNAGTSVYLPFKGRWLLSSGFIKPDDEFHFEIMAGQVNYPGSLIVRTNELTRSAMRSTSIRVRNRSAMAVRELRGKYRDLFENYRIRYAGIRGDTFLEHWETARRRVKTEEPPSGAASRESQR